MGNGYVYGGKVGLGGGEIVLAAVSWLRRYSYVRMYATLHMNTSRPGKGPDDQEKQNRKQCLTGVAREWAADAD